MRRAKTSATEDAICHYCGEGISTDTYVRGFVWALEMVGVRWAYCSTGCARKAREDGTDQLLHSGS